MVSSDEQALISKASNLLVFFFFLVNNFSLQII